MNRHEALVQAPPQSSSGRRGRILFAQSTLPEYVGTAKRARRVDLELRAGRKGLSPKTPLVPVNFAGNTVRFGPQQIGIVLEGAQPRPAQNLGHESFQAGVLPDTDLVDTPTATGAEQLLQLRSPAAPDTFRFNFHLPPGSHLAGEPDGSALVLQGRRQLLRVMRPTAVDASGRPFSSRLSVAGSSLILTVLHHERRDVTYPLTVDPLYVGGDCANGIPPHVQDPYSYTGVDCLGQQAGVINTGNPETFAQWTYAGGGTALNHANSGYSIPSGYWGSGLFVWSQANVNYVPYSWGEWLYQAPPGAFIQQVDFYRAEHQLAWGGSSSLFEGIWSTTNSAWEPLMAYDTYGFTTSYLGQNPYYIPGQRAYYQQELKVGNNADPFVSSATGTPGHMAAFGMTMGGGVRSNVTDEVFAQGATVFLYDTTPPSMTSTAPASSSQWRNDNNQTYTVNLSASDNGLGMKYFNLGVLADGRGTSFQQAQNPCTGDHIGGYCPANWSTSMQYQLPEGNDTVIAQPFDALQNAGQNQTWTAKIDRTSPTIAPDPQDTVASGTLPLTGTVSDPPPSDGATQSGVASVQAQLTDARGKTSTACTAIPSGGAYTCNWNTSAFADGTYSVNEVAYDNADNQASSSLGSIVVDNTAPTVAVSGAAYDARNGGPVTGSLSLTVSASDPGPASTTSGVADIETMIDGTTVLGPSAYQACPAFNCSTVPFKRVARSTPATSRQEPTPSPSSRLTRPAIRPRQVGRSLPDPPHQATARPPRSGADCGAVCPPMRPRLRGRAPLRLRSRINGACAPQPGWHVRRYRGPPGTAMRLRPSMTGAPSS